MILALIIQIITEKSLLVVMLLKLLQRKFAISNPPLQGGYPHLLSLVAGGTSLLKQRGGGGLSLWVISALSCHQDKHKIGGGALCSSDLQSAWGYFYVVFSFIFFFSLHSFSISVVSRWSLKVAQQLSPASINLKGYFLLCSDYLCLTFYPIW